MPVTHKQIAQRIGLSPQAVGFALRGDGTLAPETRERILEAAHELGYDHHSNRDARALVSRRYGQKVQHGVIGVFPVQAGSLPTPFHVHLHAGINAAAHRHGFEVLTINPSPSPGWKRVDGVLGPFEEDHINRLSEAMDVPVVGMLWKTEGHSCVVSDEANGIRQAMKHLLALGHRRIGYLLDAGVSPVVPRLAAYRETLREAGIEPEASWQWHLHDWGAMEVRGRICMEEWLKHGFRETGLTALLVQNDRSAMGAMESLQAHGVRVPQDVSVVGFDSTDECEICSPKLTSVRIPLEEIGAGAVEMLLRRIATGETGPEVITFPVELEVRNSTAPPGVH